MDRRITWAEDAWRDIEETATYIAWDSEHYAKAFIRQIRDAARSLRALPYRGRVVTELNNPSVRELIVGSYRLVYHVEEGEIHILGIVHGSRNLGALWQREGRDAS